MTDIRELFEQAVTQAPPSRLSAAEIYHAGRRRWRRRRITGATAIVSTGIAVMLVGGVGVIAQTGDVPGPRRSALGPTERSSPMGPLRWAGMADADHLFLIRATCTPDASQASPGPSASPAPPRPRCDEFLASDDGGVTWQSRGLLPETLDMA